MFFRFPHLLRRARAAYGEGGLGVVRRRFRRWLEHRLAQRFPSRSYKRWIAGHSPSPAELRRQRDWSESLPDPIRISLVCPLHRTPAAIFQQTLASVQNQSYPFWELCLTLAEEDTPELRAAVREAAERDSRIRVIALVENRGISGNTNAALAAATGSWIGFLDHDDLLAPQALYAVAYHLTENPNCDLVYSDEDLLSAGGKFRKTPVLKPDWSPEMLLHFNYICHFVVVRKTLVEQAGGLRAEYDGAQDWDFLLRVTELTDRIAHLPEILYHWRELPTSTAAHVDAKPYVIEAQQAALKDCFQRRGIEADVQAARYGHYRPEWRIDAAPLVSIIIPSRDQPRLIRRAVAGILDNTRYLNTEIVIVDNGSTDPDVLGYYREWQSRGQIRVVDFPVAFNYSAACNRGAAAARGEYLLFLNNDVEILRDDWLDELVGWGQQPGVGMVGGHLIYPDGRTQHAGIVLGLFGLAGHAFYQSEPETFSPFGLAEWTRNVSAVTGACQLISRDLFESLGGFDENYKLLYSDIDLCLKVRNRGRRIVYTPYCRLVHHECSTRPPRENAEDAQYFARQLEKWNAAGDPYYHPALSAHSVVPQLVTTTGSNVAANLAVQISRHVPNMIPENAQADTSSLLRRAA